ncbi:MAG TPA: BON domain-containing protein [Chloroflexia bacterium]|nr:BON domain-containing protein [Chloroflexia bacterium]
MHDESKIKRDSYTGEPVPQGGGDVLNLGPEYLVEAEEPSFANDPGTTDRLKYNDDELAEKVTHALRNDAYTTDLDIDVEVEDGIVYLRGRVNSLDDVEQAEEVAGRVDGVVDVEEELEII